MSSNKYRVERAVTGRAKCNECGGIIKKEALRIAKVKKGNYWSADAIMHFWYHPRHFFHHMQRTRPTTKKVKKPSDLIGFSSLQIKDQKVIKKLIEKAMESPGKNK